MLETFGYWKSCIRRCWPAATWTEDSIVAHVTIDEDGNCLDGSDAEALRLA